LHLSFREFLFNPEKKGEWFWVDEMKTHNMIATKCIELMSTRNGIRENVCNLGFPGKLREEIDERILQDCLPPEVQYACQNWVSHLVQGGNQI
jgi:hypothetical protein